MMISDPPKPRKRDALKTFQKVLSPISRLASPQPPTHPDTDAANVIPPLDSPVSTPVSRATEASGVARTTVETNQPRGNESSPCDIPSPQTSSLRPNNHHSDVVKQSGSV